MRTEGVQSGAPREAWRMIEGARERESIDAVKYTVFDGDGQGLRTRWEGERRRLGHSETCGTCGRDGRGKDHE